MTCTESTQRHPIVQAENLTRSLPLGNDQVPILNGVSFQVNHCEWIALTGPSGSGKSTLLGLLAGLDTPTTGRVIISGVDVTHMKEAELARLRNDQIGVIFQAFNLIPSLTALENVEVPLFVSANRRHARQRALDTLEWVGLADRLHHKPHQLSGGEQQRVAIARALVTQPALLIADEPTGNLDSKTGAQVLDLFARLRSELQITLIVATHDNQVAKRADRVLRLVDGRLVTSEQGAKS